MKKPILILIATLLAITSLLIVINWQSNGGDQLEVIFLNVGQGDSVLIKTPYDQQILIDGGPDNRVINQLSKNMPLFDHDLDLVILTHPHADHVTGLVEVLKRYEVSKVLHTGVLHTSPDYLAFLQVIKDYNIDSELVRARQDIVLGPDMTMELLYPFYDMSGQKVDNLNNTSVVTRFVYKDFKVMLTGDAEAEEEAELAESGFNLQSDIYKAGHHGSSTASSDNFLNLVKPEAAVIQCGKDNDFGHPHLRVLKRFKLHEIEVYRNDLQGQIRVVSNGQGYEVISENR